MNKKSSIQNLLIVAAFCGLPLSASAQAPPSHFDTISFDAIGSGCFYDRGHNLQLDDLRFLDPLGELAPTTVSSTAWQRDWRLPAENIICE